MFQINKLKYLIIFVLIIFILFFFIYIIFNLNIFQSINDLKDQQRNWKIWSLIYFPFLFLLIFSIFFYLYKYKKENKNVFEIEKITIMSMFFSIFIIQAFITRLIPSFVNELIPFSLDDVTVIVIGFFYGPLEAIFFGFVADTTRTIINGWAYQIMPALIFPLIGLISGFFGRIYNNIDLKNKNNYILYSILFQFVIFIYIFATILTGYFVDDSLKKNVNFFLVYIASPILFVILECVFLYSIIKQKKEISLLFFITISIIISRIITGYIIRPFSIHFFYGSPWLLGIISRIITSSYLIPSKIFISFLFLKIINNLKNKLI